MSRTFFKSLILFFGQQGTKIPWDEPSFIPGLFAVYKKENWSLFGSVTNVAGGGEVRFEQGSKTSQYRATLLLPLVNSIYGPSVLNSTDMRAKVVYLGYSFGAAYAINDVFSVSLVARRVDARKNTAMNAYYDTVTWNIDYDETADGWGGIIGLNIAPTDALNIGIRYETPVELNFKTKINNDDVPLGLSGLVDRSTANRDLPGILALGVSYKIFKALRAEANFTYYFQESANWEGKEDKVDNGYDAAIALEYSFGPKFLVSAGYMYTDSGDNPDNMFVENPALKAHSIGGGFAYMPTDKWAINFGIGNIFYKSDYQSDGTKLEKNVLLMGLGVQYKF